ncbi:unnamed protein product [Peronospora belbahrii]|uniref:Uncharacterized protein n=1 Tax=Peronospora belbahrii TaxID=622444 RepID=A0AAU9KX73_9STRA|nr:unnamed protein product [Peronospora belbahrii]
MCLDESPISDKPHHLIHAFLSFILLGIEDKGDTATDINGAGSAEADKAAGTGANASVCDAIGDAVRRARATG